MKKQVLERIEVEKEKYSKNTIKHQALYGWGNNNFGQLAIE
jgi:hypothetical protein